MHTCAHTHTHQHLLQLLYSLVGHTDAIDLLDLVSYVQRSWNKRKARSVTEVASY